MSEAVAAVDCQANSGILKGTLRGLAESSVELIARHQHPGGAYPASPTFSVYGYSWLRDGSFIADAMSRAGRVDSADAFFGWCTRVISARSGRIAELVHRTGPIPAADMLPTRYTLDGGEGEEPWWDYQLDGYGTWLWALAAHTRRHGLSLEPYESAISSTVEYLTRFGADPCYDWWEEHAEHRHTSTLASVAAGLRAVGASAADASAAAASASAASAASASAASAAAAAASAADADIRSIDRLIQACEGGYLPKWVGSEAVDGSLLAVMTPFAIVEPGSVVAERTYEKIRADLLRGGVYRYLGDTFYGGGEWLILTAWLGWYEARTGRTDLARQRLEWVAAQATTEGHLPEQVSGAVQDPAYIEEWTKRWGPVATPLLWSHAMYVTLATELGVL